MRVKGCLAGIWCLIIGRLTVGLTPVGLLRLTVGLTSVGLLRLTVGLSCLLTIGLACLLCSVGLTGLLRSSVLRVLCLISACRYLCSAVGAKGGTVANLRSAIFTKHIRFLLFIHQSHH